MQILPVAWVVDELKKVPSKRHHLSVSRSPSAPHIFSVLASDSTILQEHKTGGLGTLLDCARRQADDKTAVALYLTRIQPDHKEKERSSTVWNRCDVLRRASSHLFTAFLRACFLFFEKRRPRRGVPRTRKRAQHTRAKQRTFMLVSEGACTPQMVHKNLEWPAAPPFLSARPAEPPPLFCCRGVGSRARCRGFVRHGRTRARLA